MKQNRQLDIFQKHASSCNCVSIVLNKQQALTDIDMIPTIDKVIAFL